MNDAISSYSASANSLVQFEQQGGERKRTFPASSDHRPPIPRESLPPPRRVLLHDRVDKRAAEQLQSFPVLQSRRSLDDACRRRDRDLDGEEDPVGVPRSSVGGERGSNVRHCTAVGPGVIDNVEFGVSRARGEGGDEGDEGADQEGALRVDR